MTIRRLLNDTDCRGLTVTLRGRLACRCPVNDRQDSATVEITYEPTASLIELESFADYLATFADRHITHEMVTAEILNVLNEETGAGCNGFTVVTTWEPVEGVECVVTARL
jgi:NADPH-dependent 7-cyano-7-deazaguanine reductase QueF